MDNLCSSKYCIRAHAELVCIGKLSELESQLKQDREELAKSEAAVRHWRSNYDALAHECGKKSKDWTVA